MFPYKNEERENEIKIKVSDLICNRRVFMKSIRVFLVCLAAAGLAACASTSKTTNGDEGMRLSMPADKTIYFDFDKSEVRNDQQGLVTAHAKYLASKTKLRSRVEGHCDERGSREYNVGLGERRSQAVRRLMLFQGVADRQMETVSYGEERPADKRHNEDAWSRNRRVELVYLK